MSVSLMPTNLRRLLIAASCVAIIIVETSCAADDSTARLREIWAAARSQVVSGRIEYLQFVGGYGLAVTTQNEVKRLFNEALETHGERHSDIIREFSCRLAGKQTPTGAPVWPILVFTFDGPRTRLDRYGITHIYNGETSINARPVSIGKGISQITIGSPPDGLQHSALSFASFCLIPDESSASSFTLSPKKSANGKIVLETDPIATQGLKVTTNQSGDVLDATIYHKGGGVTEWIQASFKVFDGGVRLPQLVLRCEYSNDVLLSADITTVVEAEFNLEIDPSQFVCELKKGDLVVDNRGRQRVIESTIIADDVLKASFASNPLVEPGIARDSSSSRRLLWLVTNAAVVLILVVAVFYRRVTKSGLR